MFLCAPFTLSPPALSAPARYYGGARPVRAGLPYLKRTFALAAAEAVDSKGDSTAYRAPVGFLVSRQTDLRRVAAAI
jgi:hypothetical protein